MYHNPMNTKNSVQTSPDISNSFIYGTPLKVVRVLLLSSIALSMILIYLFINWHSLMASEPIFFRWSFLILSIGFLCGGLNPQNWKSWNSFIANEKGIFFPNEIPSSKKTQYLFVPWVNIASFKIVKIYPNKKGPSLQIIITNDEKEKFFNDIIIQNRILGLNSSALDGHFVVPYTSIFHSHKKVITKLKKLKANVTYHRK